MSQNLLNLGCMGHATRDAYSLTMFLADRLNSVQDKLWMAGNASCIFATIDRTLYNRGENNLK